MWWTGTTGWRTAMAVGALRERLARLDGKSDGLRLLATLDEGACLGEAAAGAADGLRLVLLDGPCRPREGADPWDPEVPWEAGVLASRTLPIDGEGSGEALAALLREAQRAGWRPRPRPVPAARALLWEAAERMESRLRAWAASRGREDLGLVVLHRVPADGEDADPGLGPAELVLFRRAAKGPGAAVPVLAATAGDEPDGLATLGRRGWPPVLAVDAVRSYREAEGPGAREVLDAMLAALLGEAACRAAAHTGEEGRRLYGELRWDEVATAGDEESGAGTPVLKASAAARGSPLTHMALQVACKLAPDGRWWRSPWLYVHWAAGLAGPYLETLLLGLRHWARAWIERHGAPPP